MAARVAAPDAAGRLLPDEEAVLAALRVQPVIGLGASLAAATGIPTVERRDDAVLALCAGGYCAVDGRGRISRCDGTVVPPFSALRKG